MTQQLTAESLHTKLLAFVGVEFARASGRQIVKLELQHAQKGYRPNVLQTWDREEDPALFDLSNGEKLVNEIISKAADEADSYGTGKHRFVLMTYQFLGANQRCTFVMSAQFTNDVDGTETDEGSATERGVLAQQMGMNKDLMRTNAQMFTGTLGVLSRVNEDLSGELVSLRQENASLRKQIENAESLKDERDMKAMAQISSDARKDKAVGKIIQLLPIVASRFMGKGGIPGAPSPIAMLANELRKSLSQEQIIRIASQLDQPQAFTLMELMRQASLSAPPEPKEDTKPVAEAAISGTAGYAASPEGDAER